MSTISSALEPQPKISHQAVWVVACRVVGIVCTFASNLLVARLLGGPEGFGVFLLATTVLSLGCILALSGLSEAGLRFVSENLGIRRESRASMYMKSTLRWVTISSIVASVAVVAFLILYDVMTDDPRLNIEVILLIGLGIVVLAWQHLSSQLLRSLNDLRGASFFSGGQTGGPLSNLIFLITLAVSLYLFIPLTETQVIGLLVGSICVTLPVAVFGLWRSGKKILASPPSDEEDSTCIEVQRDLAGVASAFLGIQMLAFITVQSDFWIGGSMLESKDFGLYGAAKRIQLIAHMPIQMALMTVQATVPRIYAQGRLDALEKYFRTAMTWAGLPAMLAVIVFLLYPSGVLSIVFGDAFIDGASIVIALTIGLAALVFFGSPADVLAFTGNHQLVLRVNAFSAVALIVCGIVGAKLGGAMGLAIGTSLVAVTQNVVFWLIARRRLHIWTHLSLLLVARR